MALVAGACADLPHRGRTIASVSMALKLFMIISTASLTDRTVAGTFEIGLNEAPVVR